MRYILKLFVLVVAVAALSACAGTADNVAKHSAKPVKTIYVWDADRHTDIALLTGLKGEAGAYLRSKGFMLSADPAVTDAYLKISVTDAYRDADKGRSYIKARLYILDATDNSVIYDRTYEADASGGGVDGPEYPIRKFIEEAMREFVK